MCTLLTIDNDYWTCNRKAVVKRIRQDAMGNADGFSLVGISVALPQDSLHLQTMDVNLVLHLIGMFFANTKDEPTSRIFLHSRAATTGNIGIPYCHGFTDLNGQFIMHNGILSNDSDWAVDSFRIVNMNTASPWALLKELVDKRETFANIFIISETEYSVIKVASGRLYTDGQGNYSTNPLGSIKAEVGTLYAENHLYPSLEDAWDEDDFTFYNQGVYK